MSRLGRAAQKGRGQLEGQPLVGRVESELLLVARNAREVDPGQVTVGLAEAQVDAHAPWRELGETHLAGLAEHAAQRVDLVDEVVEQDPAIAPAGLLVGVGRAGRRHRSSLSLSASSDVSGRSLRLHERVVRHVGSERRLERRHPNQAQIREVTRELDQALVGGVIALHRPDHQHDAGALGRAEHLRAAFTGERHRLLGEHVQPGLGGLHRNRRMVARGEDHHGIEVL